MIAVDPLGLIGIALDQAADALDHVRREDLPRPTPCAEWDVSALVDHLGYDPVGSLAMLRGEQADWAHPPHLSEEWGPAFRVAADDLRHAWDQRAEAGDDLSRIGMQCAEFAVHTWDLRQALGRGVDGLDPEVAEAGLAFLQANLAPEYRGAAFAPEQPAPDGADPYTRLAAYAGRNPVEWAH